MANQEKDGEKGCKSTKTAINRLSSLNNSSSCPLQELRQSAMI